MDRKLSAPAIPSYRAALVVTGDVIELDGQPWRVREGSTGPKTRTLRLRHAQFPGRERTIRRALDARIPMAAVVGWTGV